MTVCSPGCHRAYPDTFLTSADVPGKSPRCAVSPGERLPVPHCIVNSRPARMPIGGQTFLMKNSLTSRAQPNGLGPAPRLARAFYQGGQLLSGTPSRRSGPFWDIQQITSPGWPPGSGGGRAASCSATSAGGDHGAVPTRPARPAAKRGHPGPVHGRSATALVRGAHRPARFVASFLPDLSPETAGHAPWNGSASARCA